MKRFCAVILSMLLLFAGCGSQTGAGDTQESSAGGNDTVPTVVPGAASQIAMLKDRLEKNNSSEAPDTPLDNSEAPTPSREPESPQSSEEPAEPPQSPDDLITCQVCNGAGNLGECAACDGLGYTTIVNTKMSCGYCDGTGVVTCFICNGSGVEKRSNTEPQTAPQGNGGQGGTPGGQYGGGYQDDHPNHETPCPTCNGSKKETCSSCHGLGYLEQTKYAPGYGQGEKSYTVHVQCRNCNGTKQMTCRTCWGKGTT